MSSDEQMVLQYLNSFPGLFVSPAEVSKRAADRRRFTANPDWARRPLQLLAMQGLLETNASGHYRTKLREKPEEEELAPATAETPPEAASEEAPSTPKEASPVSELKPILESP